MLGHNKEQNERGAFPPREAEGQDTESMGLQGRGRQINLEYGTMCQAGSPRAHWVRTGAHDAHFKNRI